VADVTATLALSTSYQAITGASVTVTPANGQKVLVLLNAHVRNTSVDGSASVQVALFVDGVQSGTDANAGASVVGTAGSTIDVGSSSTKAYLLTGDGAQHVYTMRAKKTNIVATPTCTVEEAGSDLTVVLL
jgi:hypothetical protein